MGKTFNFISGALFGAAAGAIIGVALAPRSGAGGSTEERTRDKVESLTHVHSSPAGTSAPTV